MAADLMALLQNEFSGDVMARLASQIGEPESKTKAAVGAALPAILGALSQKLSAPTGSADLLGLFQRGGFDGGMFKSLSSVLSQAGNSTDVTKASAPFLTSLFGSQQAGVLDWLSASSGVSRTSATTLLSLIVPFALNWIAEQATASGGLNAGTLSRLLGAPASWLAGAPAGLAAVLGAGPFERPAIVRPEAPVPVPVRSGLGWLKWAVPLVAVVAVVAAARSCGTTVPDTGTVGTSGTSGYPGLGPLIDRTLPGGTTLHVPENGVESKLIAFITDTSRPVDKTTWFSFDRLEFETASATLKPSSQEQLSNIAAILKAYPSTTLKIGGYTDNTGDQSANMSLSRSRAQNTMSAIATQGVSTSRLEAEGYGEQHPVASNDTEEGRQQNRRVDVLVTAK